MSMNSKTREAVAALAGASIVAVAACVVGGRYGFHQHAVDVSHAARIEAHTAALDRQVAEGETVAAHRHTAYAQAGQLVKSFPLSVDDASLISAVLNASSAAGVQTPGESRSAPATSSGTTLVPMAFTTSANGPSPASVIDFVGLLQQQPRMIAVNAVQLTFASGAQASAAGTAYMAAGVTLPPQAIPTAP
jgi:hypothetical protein